MENKEKLFALHNLFTDVSGKLTNELHKLLPDAEIIKECRKQLFQLDKDIYRIQRQRDIDFSS